MRPARLADKIRLRLDTTIRNDIRLNEQSLPDVQPVSLEAEVARLQAELAAVREKLADTEKAFGRFVPGELLHLLSIDNVRDVRLGMQTERKMTILFADIVQRALAQG